MLGDIQEGIHWYAGAKPSSHYKLLILRPSDDIGAMQLRQLIRGMWVIIDSLRSGIVPSLGPNYPVDPKNLEVLIGYGHKFFERDDLVRPTPEGMIQSTRFPQPQNNGDRSVLPGSGIVYDENVLENVADAELVLQVTANSELSVNRVHFEIVKYLNDTVSGSGGSLISITEGFSGFGREDRRSWIDFHDGISNLRKGEERRQVVAIKPDNSGGQEWTLNGTYMVFMRLPVNIQAWNAIPELRQEALVGRTKRSGCPILRLDNNGNPISDTRCPVSGTREITDAGNENFREPSSVVSDDIKLSHVQRANHHRSPVFKPDSRRIYRQGFEFLEKSDESGKIRAGLNFVSFQDDPDRVLFILTQSDWLGNLTFGGHPSDQQGGLDRLITARAAGTYYVPPIQGNLSFPGEDMFPQ
ncbi:peroxidase [Vibrio cyclitrophicus]|uniref:Dyp-type peroxidase n=2 Tax=Vibrio cyclitrophicus TaxID=47951 RepID=UPI000C842319|nr:Dyp-type peroxidase domain-containing protein [Vibrio cyclitrophicus]NOH44424.1 peroxidase [Vibrio cyclitrophicus]PME77450.1 hypothetical protein BCV29_12670 [Vibrio cyclitrophicus]